MNRGREVGRPNSLSGDATALFASGACYTRLRLPNARTLLQRAHFALWAAPCTDRSTAPSAAAKATPAPAPHHYRDYHQQLQIQHGFQLHFYHFLLLIGDRPCQVLVGRDGLLPACSAPEACAGRQQVCRVPARSWRVEQHSHGARGCDSLCPTNAASPCPSSRRCSVPAVQEQEVGRQFQQHGRLL